MFLVFDKSNNGRIAMKSIYICGPLTELDSEIIPTVKRLYEIIADVCLEVTGIRAFVPHEHYDPKKNANFTPQEVDGAERDQVCNKTSLLIVIAIAPSWGGGIEVEMANTSNVPVIILCEKEKLEAKKISRLLRGNPAVKKVITYKTQKDAILSVRFALNNIIGRGVLV